MTAETVAEYNVVLCVKDTTKRDYDRIVAKKEGYGLIGKGGNGLILHSVLPVIALLSVGFCRVNRPTPYRFDNPEPLPVYAVYATEVDCPEGEPFQREQINY